MTESAVRLRIDAPALGPSAQAAGRETEWRDEYGTVAFGWSDGTHSSMRLPGVGVYGWSHGSDLVTAIPEPTRDRALVVDTFHRCVLPMVLQTIGRQVLHGSAVLFPDGVVALCARSRTGKSTLACALSQASGHPLWADDAVAFEPGAEDGVASIPVPFALKLRDPSAAWFGPAAQATTTQVDVAVRAAPPPLLAAFTLTRSDTLDAPRATRLTAGSAFTALLEHAYCFDVDDPALHERIVRQYLELAARVPAFELAFPSGFEALADTVEVILGTLERELG